MHSKLSLSKLQNLSSKRFISKSAFITCGLVLALSTKSFSKDPSDIPNFPSVSTPGSDNNNPQAHPPHTSAPFDAGLTILLAAGIGYGFKKARDNRRMYGEAVEK
ncbi:MAG TPA: hypothetical protein VKA49_07450 [Flavitalea sp.]|nr:hypothetical protein [Flavitalea sp.]